MTRTMAPRMLASTIVRTVAGTVLLASAAGVAMAAEMATPAAVGKHAREGLIEFMASATTELSKGLALGATLGEPISARFEVEGDQPQLSIYVRKGGEFFEVLVDHRTVNVLKVVAIEEGEDLAAAKAQDLAMDRAKMSLSAAAERVMVQTANARLLQAIPRLKEGHPVASVDFVKDHQVETIDLPLD